MGIDISQRITDYWPRTESYLLADTNINYTTAKANAIASAKRAVYGTATVPAESAIPDLVGEYIADQATLRLIPIGREWYVINRPSSKDTGRGERINYESALDLLDDLKAQLEAACSASREYVEGVIGTSLKRKPTPQVSYDGMMINPHDRALVRGIPD